MSRRNDKVGESSRQGSALSQSGRNAPAPCQSSPRRRASWLTITEVPPDGSEQLQPAQSSSLRNWNQVRGVLGSVIDQQRLKIPSTRAVSNPTSNSASHDETPNSQPGGNPVSTVSSATRQVSQNFPFSQFPSMASSGPSSIPALAQARGPAGNVMTEQPSSSKIGMNELPRDPQVQRNLQLQKVEMNPNICKDIVSVLNQQSAFAGRNNGLAMAVIPAPPGAPSGPYGPSGTARNVGNAGQIGAFSYNGRNGPANHVVPAGPAGNTSPLHGFYGAAIPSGPAASRKGKAPVVPVNLNNIQGPNNSGSNAPRWPRGTRLPQGPTNPTIAPRPPPPPPPPPPTSSGLNRPSDSKGPYGRLFYPGFRAGQSSDSVPVSTVSQTVSVPATFNQGNATQMTTVSTGTIATGFVPMLAVTRPDMTGRDVTPMPLASKAVVDLKFSPRYHGMHTENNASVDHLRPEQNCALWITQLPPDVKVTELLGKIRNIGRVYAVFINPSDGVAHPKAAAKLVFFKPEGAQKLLRQVWAKPIVIRGHRAQITPNRIKYGEHYMENGESRVLIITGNKMFVNRDSLTAYFEGRFAFQLDDIHTLVEFHDRAVIEYKFGSYRCQSQMGMKALLLDRPRGLEMVEYGADPCEVGSDSTSFSIAGERIQGRGICLPMVVQ